ncbi:ABC transporter permease [Nocardioides sp. NPDC101246]|uniref:ABC transporter permease n=1 Tax=Nocardioides sp. NPDC101246 TaxID=3364336 RepID=UPI00381E6327
MLRVAIGRAAALVPLLLIATFTAFLLLQMTATDPAVVRLGENASDEAYAAFRHEIGVDRPLLVQYGSWLAGAVRGDLGVSWSNSASVTDLLTNRMPATFSIALGALVVGLVIGLPVGIAAGIRAGRSADSLLTAGASLGQAVPSFWLALLFVAYVAMKTSLFPATGYVPISEGVGSWLLSITLPSVALGAAAAGAFARQTRAGYVRVLHEPYIRTAVAGGLARRRILWRTALRNAAIPVVTTVAGTAAVLVGGAVIVEQVFALPGLGQLVLNAIHNGDMPVVLGFVALMALLMALVQFVLDLTYALVDPRVRAG